MLQKKISFTGALGHPLAALLDLPVDGAPLAYALFAHCFTCSKDFKAAFHISRALARERIAVLRFDFTGLGDSAGDFADTSLTSNVEDLRAAAAYLAEHFAAPQILVGHSLGGAAVLQAAASLPSVRAVATIGAPAEVSHVIPLLADARPEIESQGSAEVQIEGRRFRVGKGLLDDLEHTHMRETIANLRRALLILHAPLDEVVSVDNAAAIFRAARHPKSFISLDRADHLLSDAVDSAYAGGLIAAWAKRYVNVSELELARQVDPDNRVVARTGSSGFVTEIIANGQAMLADEPLAAGGTNQGPSPYDFLLAGLGACTAMTLRMYADRKGLPVDAITVALHHSKRHAADCETCETRTGRIDFIDREIAIEGALEPAQRQRMLEIADRCPVHRTLHAEVKVDSRLVDEG